MGRCFLVLGFFFSIVAPVSAEEVPSFRNEIVPLLTRQGCNQGACHGKGAGQNGFRLSLRGYAPELDHRWLTREFAGRRLTGTVPEESILLTKPTGAVPHEGGILFRRGSREYKLLRDWLAAGAPGPNSADPKIVALRVEPNTATLRIGETCSLRVTASFTDGSQRDVTWLTKFEANDAGLLRVTPEGQVTALRHGETAVRAAFLTEVAVGIFTMPYDQEIPAEKYRVPFNNPIDAFVFAKLEQLRIEPADLSSDAEFLRRVFLDTIGLPPTPDEVRRFLHDSRTDKRQAIIEELLRRSEFIDFWTLQLADLLQNRKERDHDVRGVKGVRQFHAWLREQVAAGRRWDELVRAVLTAKGSHLENPAVGYFIVTVGEHREAEKSEVVAGVAQAFLGTRIGCAQCHNHPLERYTQDDYYHFAGFFSRIRLDRKDPRQGFTTLHVGSRGSENAAKPAGVHQPRTGEFLKPQPLDRRPMNVKLGEDPREHLVAWMTDPKNEYFSGAMVNRLWRHFFGVGLVEPVDDLRATNPPSNPALWKFLHEEFVRSKFDLKHLMRLILNSRTYQLSSATTPRNATDTRYYSHYYARRLPAEVLLDTIAATTGVPDTFPGYPRGIRAVQVPDPGLKTYFLSLFGKSERVTACACERNGDVTMPQLLHLQNSENLLNRIRAAEGRLARLLHEEKNDQRILEELFLAAFGRMPSATEQTAVLTALADSEPRDEVFADLLWALLNSKNFAFNH